MAYKHNKKWRESHRDIQLAQKLRYYSKLADGRPNNGKLWTTDELRAIHDPHRPSDRELADILGRGVRAIHNKRCTTPPPSDYRRKEVIVG